MSSQSGARPLVLVIHPTDVNDVDIITWDITWVTFESPMVIILYNFPHWTYMKIIDLPVFHYAQFLDDCPYILPEKKKQTAEVTERSRSSPAAAQSRSNQIF